MLSGRELQAYTGYFIGHGPLQLWLGNGGAPIADYDAAGAAGAAQQALSAWIGGHFSDPYEQKTQQSPAFGRSIAWQAQHS